MILLVELEVGIAFLTFALSSEDKADGAEGIVAAFGGGRSDAQRYE
jgi:hypothetical protein